MNNYEEKLNIKKENNINDNKLKNEIEFDFEIEEKPILKPNNKKIKVEKNNKKSQEKIVLNYLEENEQLISQEYDKPNIITDDDEYGKLVTIMEAFKSYDSSIELDHLVLGRKNIPINLLIIKDKINLAIGFLNIGGSAFTSRIKNFNQLVISNCQIKFYLLRDKREGSITGKVGLEEIDKLNYTNNGQFLIIEKEEKVIFELMYKMIVAINQNDLEVSLGDAMKIVLNKYANYWLIKEIFE